MGLAAAPGVAASGLPSAGDQANGVVSGSFLAVGPSQPFAFLGTFNVAIWAAYNTALTTTAGSLAATVASAGAIAAGCAINSTLVPPGSTVKTIAGTAITIALPAVSLQGQVQGNGRIIGLFQTAGLLGAAAAGPGIPAGAVVAAILIPATQQTGVDGTTIYTPGMVQLSTSLTTPQVNKNTPSWITFTPTGTGIAAGTDANALFTGAAITWSANIQLERSFDGGYTWLLGNLNVQGMAAQWAGGSAVDFNFVEPEKAVLYRLNCTGYTSGAPNYRMSSTGGGAMSLSPGSNF